MSFWAYMLHCRGGYFYVGHTDNLEVRVAQHQTGTIPGFAASHRPVELVWSECFQTRDDAKAVEKQLKGWSRAKKMALIRGDWSSISMLAKKKDSPSTSSGTRQSGGQVSQTTDCPELVEGLSLLCHPDTPSKAVRAVTVDVFRRSVSRPRFALRFRVSGDMSRIALGTAAAPRRSHELWLHTCFEAFVAPLGMQGYHEFNFAPSLEWAIYSLDGYRSGLRADTSLPDPRVGISCYHPDFELNATIYPDLSKGARVALSAVIEETDGTKSYWALAHPTGEPDFHHPDCFTLTLAPSDAE